MLSSHRFIFFLFLLSLVSIPAYASVPTVGKGMWTWQIWNSDNGNLDSVITTLKEYGVKWITVKLGDGNNSWDRPGQALYEWASQYGGVDSVIARFRENGIKVFGWQYVYGTDKWSGAGVAANEFDVTSQILNTPGIDGFIIDAEVQFQSAGMDTVAADYMDSIRTHFPHAFVALSSFPRVTGHLTFPWITFLKSCNVNMPRDYWAMRSLTPLQEYDDMWNDLSSYEEKWISEGYVDAVKPIVPTGQGEYFGAGKGNPLYPGDISEYCSLVQGAGDAGVSLWQFSGMTSPNWAEYANSWATRPAVPSVTSSTPSAGTRGFPTYSGIIINFNTQMDPASVAKGFTISPHVDGTFSMNPGLNEWTFVPDTLLNWSTKYTITVDTSADNLLGVHLAAPYSFTFTTVPKDTSGPTVIAVSPRNGGTCVSKAYVEFVMNEPVKLGSILSQITFVDSAGNKIPFMKDILEVTSNPGNSSRGLTLIALRTLISLTPGMKYTVTLAPGVSDYYNVASKSPYSSTFTVDTSENSGGTVLEDFETSLGNWQQPYASRLTFGVDTSSSSFALAYKAFDGYQAGELTYNFDSTQALCAEVKSKGYDISGISSVGMWVFGDNSGNQLDYILGTSPAKIVPVDTINWYGYKFIGMWRDQTDTTTDVFRGIAVRRLPSAILDNGTIYVDDIQVSGEVTGVKEPVAQLPASFRLFQNYPNPFNPTTSISYQLPTAVHVSLKIYDVLGREVATLVNANQKAGSHAVTLNASALASGVYFCRLDAGTNTATREMLMIK